MNSRKWAAVSLAAVMAGLMVPVTSFAAERGTERIETLRNVKMNGSQQEKIGTVLSANDTKPANWGYFGENNSCKWQLDENKGLFISPAEDGKEGSFTDLAWVNEIPGFSEITNFRVFGKVTAKGSLEGMFTDCTKLEKIDLSNLDTSQVTNMNRMFSDCSRLKTIVVPSTFTVSDKNEDMFNACINLTGGEGTAFDPSHMSGDAAVIDRGGDTWGVDKGYFTSDVPPTPPVTSFDVSFDVQGHGNAPETQYVPSGNLAKRPDSPTAEGYTFDGWYKDKECTTPWNFDSDTVTASTTLYAKWTANNYSISFDGNGNTSGNIPAAQNAVYDQDIQLSGKGDLAKNGYTFAGWNTEADGTGSTFKEGETVKNLTGTQGGNVTLYAIWNANNYTIHFDGNGNTSGQAGADLTAAIDRQVQLSGKGNLEKIGYTFAGWNTKADGTGTTYKEGDFVQNLTTDATGKVTLYAIWTKNAPVQYQITSGGNMTMEKGKLTDVKITCSGDLSRFTCLKIDGNEVAKNNYTTASGSTVVTLKKAFLETLGIGTHTVRFEYQDGFAETNLTITGNGTIVNPTKTGDTSNMAPWTILIILGGTGAAIGGICAASRKRRERQ